MAIRRNVKSWNWYSKMPFTPYHFGPSGFVGLVFRRWIDLPMFMLGNVIVDVEVLFAPARYPHRHWHVHTLLIGGLVGAIVGVLFYYIKPIRNFSAGAMRLIRITYKPGLLKMITGGITGVWMHVLIDSFYHYDVQPFFPAKRNALYWFARRNIKITPDRIETICLSFFVLVAILYALAVWSFKKQNRTNSNSQSLPEI